MSKILFLFLYMFASFGFFVALLIAWHGTEDHRYKLKTKLFPKWKAVFKKGDFVSVKDGNDEDTLCTVESVWVEKEHGTGEIRIWYTVKPTHAFNGGYSDYRWGYFECLNIPESELRQVC
jgi:hypothetical protein